MTPRFRSLREAVALSPHNIPLLLLFAEACIDELRLSEARAAFDRVLPNSPDHIEAKLGVARVLYLAGNTSEAAVRVEGLLQLQPGFAPGWLLLARLALAEGDRKLGQEYYRKAVSLNPELPDEKLERELGLEPARTPQNADAEIVSDGGIDPRELSTDDEEFTDESIDVEKSEVTFADVGGMDDIKEEIRMKIIYPLENRALFSAYGKKLGGGVLLYGPPGCGKTLISKATAGEINANFISVGIHQILDLYVGSSERNLHQLFQSARDNAPAVLFFDEVDALAADRKDFRESAMRTVINQFLAEMDGNVGSNEGILILGATNAPWHLDPAFRRPGRFDRIIFVPPPDESARKSIVDILGRDKPIKNLDAFALAKRTREYSGADLKSMFDIATERALSRAMKEGRVVPITTEDLFQACKGSKPSTRVWFESAKNYALYANQGGFYDDVLSFLGIRK
jgi:transitional endoplasmic reticulum ATPase